MFRFLLWIIIAIIMSISYVSGSVIYPTATPNGETGGGTFSAYFTNMLKICNNNQLLRGFDQYGFPNCVSISGGYWNILNGESSLSYSGGNIKITNGGIQIGNNNNICTPSMAGSVRYNSSLKILEFCDGTDWGKILFQQTSFPTNLVLSHSSRSKNFTFSWSAGTGNGGSCKLQYYKNGTTWTDISNTIYNCDSNLSNINVTLPNDGWYSGNWNGTQIQIMRTSDTKLLGRFPQTLSCTVIGASSSSTPSIDEDCNGVWDNSSSYQSSYNYDCSYNSCYTTTCSRQVFKGTYLASYYCDGRGLQGACTPTGGIVYYTTPGVTNCNIASYFSDPYEASFWHLTSCIPEYSNETYSCQSCNWISRTCTGYSTSYNYY